MLYVCSTSQGCTELPSSSHGKDCNRHSLHFTSFGLGLCDCPSECSRHVLYGVCAPVWVWLYMYIDLRCLLRTSTSWVRPPLPTLTVVPIPIYVHTYICTLLQSGQSAAQECKLLPLLIWHPSHHCGTVGAGLMCTCVPDLVLLE